MNNLEQQTIQKAILDINLLASICLIMDYTVIGIRLKQIKEQLEQLLKQKGPSEDSPQS